MRKSNYDKFPATAVDGTLWRGWEAISAQFASLNLGILAIDCYAGVLEEEIIEALRKNFPALLRTRALMKSETQVRAMTKRFMTDDVLFGYLSPLRLKDFFDEEKLAQAKADLKQGTLIVGPGAAVSPGQRYGSSRQWSRLSIPGCRCRCWT